MFEHNSSEGHNERSQMEQKVQDMVDTLEKKLYSDQVTQVLKMASL